MKFIGNDKIRASIENLDNLTLKLSKYIENHVHRIGGSTEGSISVIGKEYKTVKIKVKKFKDIKKIWQKFVIAYCYMQTCLSKSGDLDKQILTLYWRTKPLIRKEEKFYFLRARLLIDNREIAEDK